jgi:hypothetical protein
MARKQRGTGRDWEQDALHGPPPLSTSPPSWCYHLLVALSPAGDQACHTGPSGTLRLSADTLPSKATASAVSSEDLDLTFGDTSEPMLLVHLSSVPEALGYVP